LKLLFVIDHFGSGGAQRQMVNLALVLARRGHAIEFLVYYPEFDFFRTSIDEAHLTVHEVPKTGRLGLAVVGGLRQLIAARDYSAVLAFMETPGVYAELACLGQRRTPLVVSERVDPPSGSSGMGLRTRSWLHRRADRIVANSHACGQEWSRRFPSLAGRVEVIWNGVDLQRFSPCKSPGRHGERLAVVAIGTLVPRKNAHGLVAAMVELKRRGHALPRLTWFGKTDNTAEGVRYRSQLEESITAAGLSNDWVWADECTDVERVLGEADLLVHASFREGLSNVICEALAAGCPVLAADVGDNRLLIGDDERGALFDPADVVGLADCLAGFQQRSVDDRSVLRQAARSFAERELGLDRYVDRYETLFESLGRTK
jgi:glycosyltransferase involved in cell wall biosynthesis